MMNLEVDAWSCYAGVLSKWLAICINVLSTHTVFFSVFVVLMCFCSLANMECTCQIYKGDGLGVERVAMFPYFIGFLRVPGSPREGGNWGTLRIPREEWGTLGKN